MIGVADVDAQGHAEELAAEVVLQPRAHNLLAVVEVLRADEPNDSVDEQSLVSAREAVGARLQGLLVAVVVRACRKAAPLPRFEVQDVVAHGSPFQGPGSIKSLAQYLQIHPEAFVRFLRAA